MINANIAALLYLVAGVLFILALRGLSSPKSSRQGNLFGMVGMAIAIVTTLAVWLAALAGSRAPASADNALLPQRHGMAAITAPGKMRQLLPIRAPSIMVTLLPIQVPSPISTFW